MKSAPSNFPRISSSLFYREPARAIDWLCSAFGFEVRLKVEAEDGGIIHSELLFGDGLIMVSGHKDSQPHLKSPRDLGGANTQALLVYVDDVEAHCERARKAGAKIVTEPKVSDYGDDYWSDSSYGAEDLEGHHWWFSQRLREPPVKK